MQESCHYHYLLKTLERNIQASKSFGFTKYNLFLDYTNPTFNILQNIHDKYSIRTKLFNEGFFKFKGMQCIGGTTTLAIDPYGNARTHQCAVGKIIGNLCNPSIKLDSNMAHMSLCKYNDCACDANDPALKFSNHDEALQYLKNYKVKQDRLSYNYL